MKTVKCDLCDSEAEGETFEDWMQNLMPHYQEAHADFIKDHSDASEEEMKAQKAQWMADNKARFDAA